MHECDRVKDGTSYGGIGSDKLVLLRMMPKNSEIHIKDPAYETVAVYSVWTSWAKLPDEAERCERCARYRILNKNGYCKECQTHLDFEVYRRQEADKLLRGERERDYKDDPSTKKTIE
jgi:hypothetical protein